MLDVKTLVVGLGNPLFRDDNVGLGIIRKLNGQIDRSDTSVIETSASGLDFLDLLAGYDKAIIVDAIQSNQGKPGQVHKLSFESIRTSQNICSSHSLDLFNSLELGKRLNLPLPREIVIIGIEVGDISIPDGKVTPEIENAIPVCLNHILHEINLSQDECYGN